MSLTEQFNVGARIKGKLALVNTAITQTSNAAASASTGESVDRNESGLRRYYSCKLVVSAAFIGGSTAKTGILAPVFQHSSDGTSWDNYSTDTAQTRTYTGTTEKNTVEQSVNLNGARRFIRVSLPAPTFSDCSSGSLFNAHAVIVFGGADELPAQ